MKSRDEVLEKVRKLLALADGNANRHEAIAAALKAQKLIAEYDIAEDELRCGEGQEPVSVVSKAYARNTWRGLLATIIADNFRCRSVTRRVDVGKRRVSYSNVFVGYSLDANAACLTYERLVEIGERLAREECRRARLRNGSARGVRNSFLAGFAFGVRGELEKQSEALMLVCPSEVIVAYNEMFGNMRSKSFSYSIGNVAYDVGRVAGKDAVRSSRLEASSACLLGGGERSEKQRA